MNKIDSILAGKEESYASFISKLETVLSPFAQVAVGQIPNYMGNILEEVGAGTCENGCHFVFKLNGQILAVVAKDKPEASVFNGELRELKEEDHASVLALVARLESVKGENPMDSILDGIVGNMPPELRQILKSVIRSGDMN